MTGRPRWVRIALVGAVPALVVALTFLLLYHEPLRRAILEPVAWMINDIRRALAPLPQAVLWAIGLLIGCFVLLVSWRRTLRGVRPRSPRPRRTAVRPHNASTVPSLARALHRARRRHVSRARIVRELSLLAERLVAKREGIPVDQARRRIQSGEWPEDPEMQRFFASRRAGAAFVPRQRFLEAVDATLEFLVRYHQEV